MSYLDLERLAGIDREAFLARRPYPWWNPRGALTDEAFGRLREELPDRSLFEPVFARSRKYGQVPHDRYVLDWEPTLPVADSWRDFVAEIEGPDYREWVAGLLGCTDFALRLHWHYTPPGCSVSPHCDAKRKLGSHIFYFQSSADWDRDWGGETLILDDGGRFHSDSSPGFEDFDRVIAPETCDNRSLLFARRGDSWHGVRPLACPEGRLRQVFIVVFEKRAPWWRRGLAAWPGARP